MKLEKCYEKIGANYKDLVNRLGSEDFANLFAKKFLTDDSFANLKKGLAEQDAETAFRAAHTLKGVCLNLGFDNLFTVSSDLTEKLRAKELEESEELFRKVKEQYAITIAALRELQASL